MTPSTASPPIEVVINFIEHAKQLNIHTTSKSIHKNLKIIDGLDSGLCTHSIRKSTLHDRSKQGQKQKMAI